MGADTRSLVPIIVTRFGQVKEGAIGQVITPSRTLDPLLHMPTTKSRYFEERSATYACPFFRFCPVRLALGSLEIRERRDRWRDNNQRPFHPVCVGLRRV